MRIKLVNFMSHVDTTCDISNLTAITGKNDSGKTAIIAAYLWVLYGKPQNKSIIFTSAKNAEVSITFDDGLYLCRWTDGKKTIVTINSNEYVTAKSVFTCEPLDSLNTKWNVSTQLSKLFMLDFSDTDTGKMLNDILPFDKVIDAQNRLSAAISDKLLDIKVVDKHIENTNHILCKYDNIQQVKLDMLEALQKSYDNVAYKVTLVDTYHYLYADYYKYSKALDNIITTDNIIIGEQEKLTNMGMSISLLILLASAYIKNVVNYDVLEVVQADITTANEQVKIIKVLDGLHNLYVKNVVNYDVLEVIQADITTTNAHINSIKVLDDLYNLYVKNNVTYDTLGSVSELVKQCKALLDKLNMLSSSIKIYKELQVAKNSLASLKKESVDVQEELAQYKDEIGVCPLCGSNVRRVL